MNIRLLENAKEIREAFMDRFVLTWEAFQVRQKAWIAEMAKNNYLVDLAWYERSFMWDRMDPGFPRVSMKEALAFLREQDGSVLFMGEKDERIAFRGRRVDDFIAQADAQALADEIEREWFDAYRLAQQELYDADAFLPDDLYVFDPAMNWCAVFTHETDDWESEIDDPMKASESRCCILFRA